MTGFVSFVSSGPGDPELLTLKAVDRLGKADAVLFDDLSAGPILEHARKDADLVGFAQTCRGQTGAWRMRWLYGAWRCVDRQTGNPP